MHTLKILIAVVWLFHFFRFSAQNREPIHLDNPSFEDTPRCCEPPRGWINCGAWLETPPDVQPGFFSVSMPPSHGKTYLGLVTRDNNTWESVGQQLARPLEKNQCYHFSLDLTQTSIYYSTSRSTGLEVNFTQPTVFRIWGGNSLGDRKEKLAETKEIKHTTWKTYHFKISPQKGSYSYLLLEAFYRTPNFEATNGHVLVDNASPIRPVSCQTNQPDVAEAKPQPTKEKKKKSEINPPADQKNKENNKLPSPDRESEKVAIQPAPSDKWSRENLKKNAIIPVENIFFEENKHEITPESEKGLQEILRFLNENVSVRIEVGGHTNLRPDEQFAMQLSTLRAQAVANWLFEHQIDSSRVTFKGYGKSKPLMPGTSKIANEKNQRVEIKILSL